MSGSEPENQQENDENPFELLAAVEHSNFIDVYASDLTHIPSQIYIKAVSSNYARLAHSILLAGSFSSLKFGKQNKANIIVS